MTRRKEEAMLRVPTSVPEEDEALIHRTIGCCIAVHRALGPGMRERIYTRAVCLELAAESIPFETEKRFPVFYRDHLICHQRVDLMVDGRLVLEIKSVDQLAPVHRKQVLSYLRISKVPVGLLINFNVAVLPDGLKRVVL
jgi:GxxExxY protein